MTAPEPSGNSVPLYLQKLAAITAETITARPQMATLRRFSDRPSQRTLKPCR